MKVIYYMNKKISVIVPVYGTYKYLRQCLDSILEQTYRNLEIIIVNDCTPDNSQEIIEEYAQKDARIKSIKNEINLGLYATRLEGVKFATGDYISFVDSDDYLSLDWFRRLIARQEETDSDIVIGQHALYLEKDKNYKYESSNQVEFEYLDGDKAKQIFFQYLGLRYSWHVVWNRIYRASLWKDNLDLLASNIRINLWEDVVFSSILFTKIKSVASIDFVGYFYRKTRSSITGTRSSESRAQIRNALTLELKQKLDSNYHKYVELFMQRDYEGGRFLVQSDFNRQYEDLINLVIDPKYKIISFDIFDTLVQRPLFEPKDLFELLSAKYIELTNDCIIDFAVAREQSELNARKITDRQEITLDEIYDDLSKNYSISPDVLKQIKAYEVELEINLCVARKSIYEIYKLAKGLNKKILFVSDMYLSKETIIKILDKSGYSVYDKLFLSSDIMLTKEKGDIFEYIINDHNYLAVDVLHIGDNKHSDVQMPRKYGITSFFYPKAIDVFMGRCGNLKTFMHYQHLTHFITMHLGTRCMLAVVAIKFYDNPFKTTALNSHIGTNPYWLGYYQLGIFVLGLANWLIEQAKPYSQISFIARDGYLIKKAYDILVQQLPGGSTKSSYLELSRLVLYRGLATDHASLLKVCTRHFDKELFPKATLMQIFGQSGQNAVKNLVYDNNYQMVEQIRQVEKSYPNLYKNNVVLSEKIKIYLNNHSVGENTCFFDIGYSRRSHMLLFNLSSKFKHGFFAQEDTNVVNKYYKFYKIDSFVQSTTNHWMLLKASELEYLISDYKVGSVIDFEYSNTGDIKPVYNYDCSDIYVEVELAQIGAVDFASDFMKFFANCWKAINFNYVHCSHFLQKFLNNSTKYDVEYFKRNKFFDNFSGLANNSAEDIFNIGFGDEESGRVLLKKLYFKYKRLSFKQIMSRLVRIIRKRMRH